LNITYAKLFNRSPLHVWTAYNDEDAQIVAPSYAMKQGTAFHWAVLEPHRLDTDVAIDPGWSKNALKYKEWAEENADKLIISEVDNRNVRRMAEKVYRKKSAMQFIQSGYPEITLLWFEPEFGIWCKGRIDWVTTDGDVLIDLKKTQVATAWAFEQSIRRYQYYHQAAHYCRGYQVITGKRPKKWIWIVSEIDPPNESNVFSADMAAVESAEIDVMEWYRRFAECEKTGEWPGYADYVIELGYDIDGMVSSMEDDIQW
jgi:exodeoxyribonuclease VIII